ncbi:hypothetical protein QCO44_05785 [Selenomonas sputigena]|uniref:Uncharacterized protein n=1 Tax=Selenomonas sputigena TaxID=69823 RepID=A0ABV3X4Q2_9FIRM
MKHRSGMGCGAFVFAVDEAGKPLWVNQAGLPGGRCGFRRVRL